MKGLQTELRKCDLGNSLTHRGPLDWHIASHDETVGRLDGKPHSVLCLFRLFDGFVFAVWGIKPRAPSLLGVSILLVSPFPVPEDFIMVSVTNQFLF